MTEEMEKEMIAEIPDSENPYLYATGGPKKQKMLGLDNADNEDYSSYDLDTQMQAAFGEYSVKHTNEKFKLGKPSGNSSANQ